ncbi:MAG TPA: TcmI family type II polyketide cyclase [Micromonospora sp.]
MGRLMIVGRLVPGTEEQVAQIFGETDASELPSVTGVRHRSLYALHDIWVHLLETGPAGPAGLEAGRDHPLFVDANKRLSNFTSPYLTTWRSPRDSIARRFYAWDAQDPTR